MTYIWPFTQSHVHVGVSRLLCRENKSTNYFTNRKTSHYIKKKHYHFAWHKSIYSSINTQNKSVYKSGNIQYVQLCANVIWFKVGYLLHHALLYLWCIYLLYMVIYLLCQSYLILISNIYHYLTHRYNVC